MVEVVGNLPSSRELLRALDLAAAELDLNVCYAHMGSYHFSLGAGWSIALSADSAGRIRIETCRLCRPVTRMWSLHNDHHRLAGLVRKLSSAVQEPV